LVLAQPPFAAVTSIPFKVGYLVESSAPLDEYVDQLEVQIIEAAVAGALQCNTGGPIFGINGTGIAVPQTTIPIITLDTGALCTPEISECTVLETAFEVLVADDLDSEVAAFLGYIFLREEMDGGSFVSENPTLDRVEYLSPLPLLPPLSEGGVNEIPIQDDLSSNDPISVSNWTLGAVIAMCKSFLLRRRLSQRIFYSHAFVLTVLSLSLSHRSCGWYDCNRRVAPESTQSQPASHATDRRDVHWLSRSVVKSSVGMMR